MPLTDMRILAAVSKVPSRNGPRQLRRAFAKFIEFSLVSPLQVARRLFLCGSAIRLRQILPGAALALRCAVANFVDA
jgi:hypothetical protein